MILRDLSDRARAEGMRAIRGFVEGVRARLPHEPSTDLYFVRGASEHHRDETVWWSRADPDAEDARDADGARVAFAENDAEVTKSLDRIAETIDRLAAQLDAHHTERA